MSKNNLIFEYREKEVQVSHIQSVEKGLGIKLPSKFVKLILMGVYDFNYKCENREIVDAVVAIPTRDKFAGIRLLSFTYEKDNKSQILLTNESGKDELPEPNKMIKFEYDGGNLRYLFDYRNNIDNPSILLVEWDEKNIYPLADSFDEFLDNMRPVTDFVDIQDININF